MSYAVYAGGNTAYPIDAYLTADQSAADALTATASGTQTTALLLAATANNVTVVATAADAVRLPLAVAGMKVYIQNSSANSMQVFGSGTDTINNVATATGVAQATLKSAVYFATTSAPAGKWFRVLSA